jgi:hypothetical protein
LNATCTFQSIAGKPVTKCWELRVKSESPRVVDVCVLVSAGPVEVPVLVSFTAPDNKTLAVPAIALTLTATGKDLPVSTLTPVVDFK